MNPSPVKALSDYFRLMNHNGASHVFRVAHQAGILDVLKSGGADPAAVAKHTGSQEQPTRLVLHVLETLGLVESRGEKFALTLMARALIESSYRNLSDEYWAHLPAFLKTGQPMAKMDQVKESETHYQAQAAALAWMLGPAAEVAAQTLLAGDARRGLRILDVGAGSAVWSLTIAQHDSAARVTAVDWPAVLKVALASAMQRGLQDRLTLLPGNFHEVMLPDAAFDLAVIGNVTHLETPEGNADLLGRVFRALRPGGEAVIFDIFPGQESGDLNRTLYELGLSLRTVRGRVFLPQELSDLMTAAGFEPPRLIPLDAPPHALGMLLARKPIN